MVNPPVSLSFVLRVWFLLGLQSFGGGVATLALIRRAAIDQYAWLTEEEFMHAWALCQIAPGINLLALTVLIGRKLAGWKGIVLTLIGLLLPSTALTILVTAFYAGIEDQPLVVAALHGIIPATVGLGLATAFGMARPLLKASRREGRTPLAMSLFLLVGSGVVFALWRPSVAVVLCGAGAPGALFYHWGKSGQVSEAPGE